MKPARIAARLGAAALTVATFGSVLAVAAPPAGALPATHFRIDVGVDGSSKFWLAGLSHTVTITALDDSGNTDTSYSGVVTLSLVNDTDSGLPASVTFTAG